MTPDRPHDPAATAAGGSSQHGLDGGPGPAFAEPWQARAFALTILASRRGCFTWPEWTHMLGRELQTAADADYFECWLCALQSLLVGKGAVGQGELGDRRHAWEDAYRRTPHGVPVNLTAR
jgi:nitrile hydratase accessory protein